MLCERRWSGRLLRLPFGVSSVDPRRPNATRPYPSTTIPARRSLLGLPSSVPTKGAISAPMSARRRALSCATTMSTLPTVRRPSRFTYRPSHLLNLPTRLLKPSDAGVGIVRSFRIVPKFDVSLDDVLNGRHLPPLTLKEFEEHLLFVEYSAENLCVRISSSIASRPCSFESYRYFWAWLKVSIHVAQSFSIRSPDRFVQRHDC